MLSLFARLRRGNLTEALSRRRRTRLEVESLEDRLVPTIVFNPAFGNETIKPGSTSAGMQNPAVNIIFSGTYWDTPTAQATEAALLNGAKEILNSPYLSGLTQYGSSGTAHFAASWNDPNSVTVDPNNLGASPGDVEGFLINSIANHSAYPGNIDYQHAPIFVMVSDPISSKGYDGGWNGPYTYLQHNPAVLGGLYERMHMIWIGTAPASSMLLASTDAFTAVLSHELAETMSDPDPGNSGTEVNPSRGLPAALANPGGNQIGDYEPDGAGQFHYAYRLNGALVQPYWSQKDNAFIVPDGQSEKFYLGPIWNAGNFTGTYALGIQGDQVGPLQANGPINDNIIIDEVIPAPQVLDITVTMNGQSAAFDHSSIVSVNVDTGGGANTVRIARVPYGAKVNVHSGGQSSDTVIVGTTNGSLANIQGAVSIDNARGQTDLQIDASNDGKESIAFQSNSVTVGNAVINFVGALRSPSGSLTGVTKLEVNDGLAANNITVSSLPPLTAVTLYADYLDQINDPTHRLHVKYTHGFPTAPGNL
jgi:hypothetical protein